ncbi:MAG: redoxin domain-containing protein [Chloroflexi bacterium]|nr:redoxin domain-containing protein [Chloroflexota bacterium]
MDRTRHALLGLATAALVAAIALACSSDDSQSQPTTEAQSEQAQQAERIDGQDQAQSSSSTSSLEQEQQQQASRETTGDAQADEPQSQPSATRSSDDQDAEKTVSASADQAAQQSEGESDAQSDADEMQQQEQQTEEAEQSAPAQQEAEDEQPEEDAEQSGQPSGPSEREQLRLRAEEIAAQATVTDLVGLNGWLNGEETTIALELAKGNVVLVDFWTYTCINCVRTLPFLTAWDEKYREHGLVILGVHTPEFEFEKVPANILAAIDEHGIEYDVPMDNDYRTWRAFNNRFWPAKYLIGPTGDSPMSVRYFHFGEGHYEETEEQIRQALEAAGRDLSDVPFGVDVVIPDRSDVARGVQTRELYGGWSRNVGSRGPYAGQEEYFLAGLGAEFLYRDVDPDERLHNVWYLQGLWRAEQQAIAHARTTEHLEDYMAMIVRARTVNVVLTVAENGQPYDVFIQFNDDWVRPEFAGEHIQWDDEGRSFVRVNQNDLFRLLFFDDFSEGELKLSSNSDQFRIFAFTFGSYVGGE